MLRLRSDEQLVSLFRGGSDEAFRIIHDRYRRRLFAYTRQMLPGSRHDAEDALQDIFVRAYCGLRANDRELALRAWLYRVAHNRCIDELRRPSPVPDAEAMDLMPSPVHDPVLEAEQRESISRLIVDIRGLPEQQRSALLMRELGGVTYADIAGALCVSVPAVRSLLVRARLGLAQALEARDTSCSEIREELILAHDRGVRPNGIARRHMRDCDGCREFRLEVRAVSRRFAALVPALGPIAALTKLLGFGGGAAASGSGAAAGGAGGAGGAAASAGVFATGASHVASVIAAAVITAGGAVEVQHAIASPAVHRGHHAGQLALGGPARDPQPPARVTAAGGYHDGAVEPPAASSAMSSTATIHAVASKPPPAAPPQAGPSPAPGPPATGPGPPLPGAGTPGAPIPTAGSTGTSGGDGSTAGTPAGGVEGGPVPATGDAAGPLSSPTTGTATSGSGSTPGQSSSSAPGSTAPGTPAPGSRSAPPGSAGVSDASTTQ